MTIQHQNSDMEIDGNSVSVSYASMLVAWPSVASWIVEDINYAELGSDDLSQDDKSIDWKDCLDIEWSSLETMVASEDVLRRDWDTPIEDAEWAHL